MNKPFFACMVRLCETDLGTAAIINGPVKEEFIFMVDNKLMLGGLDPITHREIAVNELIETLKGWKAA